MLSLRHKCRWDCRQSELMDPVPGVRSRSPLAEFCRRFATPAPELGTRNPELGTRNPKRQPLPRQTLQGFPILFARFFYDFRWQLRGWWFFVPIEGLEIVANKLFVETGRA